VAVKTTRAVPSGPPAAPHPRSLTEAREQARTCRRCDLWRRGTQTVFGEGRKNVRVMLVGEQPGDVEDKAGEPFVGPAGQLLRDALAEAGIPLDDVYLTNAVKHFKWEPRGKRRIHAKPDRTEVLACRVWLEAEIAFVKPHAIVALGATAAAAILGPNVRVTRDRARPIESPLARFVTVTVHPSSILRAPDSESRASARAQFVADLRAIAKQVR
jgi:uracil-DNA glycosylase